MNQEPPFTQEVYRGLIRPQSILSQDYEKLHPLRSPTLCAAGWEVFYYCGCMVVAHGGRAAGSSATSFFAPAVKFGAVIFGNTESAAAAGELLMQELLDEVLDIPRKQRLNQNQRIQLLSRSGLYSDAFHSKANKEIDAKAAPAGPEASKLKPGLGSVGLKISLQTYEGDYWDPGMARHQGGGGYEEGSAGH